MAAHAGIFLFDGRPAGDARAALVTGLQPLAIDGDVSVHEDRGIVLAHAPLHVWAGERSCRQPARSPSGLVITWDGRIDNRDDLLLRLGPLVTGEAGDVAIAAAAFERWGMEGLRSLIGEWSVAIWDANRRTLHLARDYMGVRPLYYYAGALSVQWSSSLGEIAVRSGRADALSDKFVAGFMALRVAGEVTPYEDVLAVPAATCLSFTATGARIRRRFWDLNPGTIRFRDRRQYEEQLRALWSDAIGARLRAGGTVWAELSGGFDSSAVVCMADALIKARRVHVQALQPISHVTLESPEGDERRFIAEVEARTGVPSAIVGVEAHQHLSDPELNWVTPFAVTGVVLAAARRIRERGGRIVLSGRAGDVVMGCEPDNSVAVLDDFSGGRVLRGLCNLRRWSRASRKPFLELAWELRGRATRPGLGRALERRAAQQRAGGAALLASRMQAFAIGSRSLQVEWASEVRAAKRELAAQVSAYAVGSQFSHQIQPRGLVYTYPYIHRPLVEFVLAIPGEELSAPGELRWLMRRGFDGLVPPRILRRISKGYYPPAILRGVRHRVAALRPVERLEVVQRGWIDPDRLDAAVSRLIDGGSGSRGEVENVLRLEQWLDARTRRARTANPQRKEVRTNEVLNA
jgi:asparagine synthase (glutamine-hydrolysing)